MGWFSRLNFWSKEQSVSHPAAADGPQLRWGVVSITGNFRENNEDRYAIDEQGRFFVVCDGMGGQSAGERASAMATELVPQRLEQALSFNNDPQDKVLSGIDDAVGHANAEIMALAQIDPNCSNMGTTIAMLVRVGKAFYVAGVGDSRVYRMRNENFEQLTTDHSLSQALVIAGTISKEDAANHRYKHVLVRYLGSKEGGAGAEAKPLDIQTGDRFMICSDGVTDGSNDTQLAGLMSRFPQPQETAEAIIQAAQAGGSKDNITCVVVFVD
ncbi:MAG: protein phosphatase 2C domain-containing protein [Planctomycetota bacterium]